ncbi:MAG: hypothetical protein K2X80_13875 [Pseudomonadaceae bacterium]|nr:hypothetical protein [Pseudomonadaceae bacterium]
MSLPKTGVIRYNLAERGRKARGVERNFDTVAAAALINGPDVQERVRHGDMLGYFGHWPRVKFGLNPAEGGVVDGKAVSVEPAIRTISLKAYPDGTVEHETEFLSTASGKLAARLHASKAGGFSSAINTRAVGNKAMPLGFYGFDYVLEPNYSTNRGYGVALGGVMDGDDVFDAVAERQQIVDQCSAMLDSMQQSYDQMQATVLLLAEENSVYLSRLAADGRDTAALDGVMELTVNCVHSHLDQADAFLTAPLVPLAAAKPSAESKPSAAASRQLSRLGW